MPQDDLDALAKRFGGTMEGQRPGYDAPPASAEQFMDPPSAQGGAAGRFFSNLGEVLNPITMAQGLYQAVRHPIDTAGNIIQQQVGQGQQAVEMFKQGRYSEAAGHGGAALLPLIGPAAAQAGEQIGSGDIAGGLGRATGILAPVAAAPAVRSAARALPNRAATALESGAADRVADVMSPKVGANKTRFGNNAEKVAPEIAKDLAREGAPLTREGLHGRVQASLMQAEQGLDAASDARLAARTFETQPLIDDLLRKRQELTAEAVDASQFPPAGRDTNISRAQQTAGFGPAERPFATPVGESVVPAHSMTRVAEIDRAIKELQQLGPVARYESIRRIRASYDQPAKVKYSPAVTTDYLAKQGGATGAADVTGVLREHLAKWDPETAAANANYHIYKTADDVLEATREVERVRPKMGRAIMARLTGTIFGGQAAGTGGAVAGYALGPVADSLLAAGGTTKLKTAAMMQRLAQAIRGGDMATVDRLADQLKRLTAESGAAMNATSPSGSQRPPVPALAGQQ